MWKERASTLSEYTMKEKIYDLVASSGIRFMMYLFPEYFGKESVRHNDRYIEYPFVLENLSSKSVKILDVGCAGSMLPKLIEAIGHNVQGLDIRKSEYTQGDICYAPFSNSSFDIVTMVSTLEHIGLSGRYRAEDDELGDMKALDEVYHILKPKGILLLTVPFGKEYKITKYHRIYNLEVLKGLLERFSYTMKTVPSPEADYQLALIKAVKGVS